MKKYSVLTYNINGYEIIHEIPEHALNPQIDYVYVTDNHDITSNTWRVVYVNDLEGSVFDKCYQIRFFPFKYVNTDVVMRIDGSMPVTNDVMPLFEEFEKGGYDASVMIHPWRTSILDEYKIWCAVRNYPVQQAQKCVQFLVGDLCYNIENYKGLYQGNFVIQRDDSFNNAWNLVTYDMLKHLATAPDTIERIDQTVWSVVLNMLYSYKKIMPVDGSILNGKYFNWCYHNTNKAHKVDNIIESYMFNEKVDTIK